MEEYKQVGGEGERGAVFIDTGAMMQVHGCNWMDTPCVCKWRRSAWRERLGRSTSSRATADCKPAVHLPAVALHPRHSGACR